MFPILIAIGQYGTMIGGAQLAYRGVRKLTKGTQADPVIAGFGDTIMTVLDPLDLSGYRAGKEQDQANAAHKQAQNAINQQHAIDMKQQKATEDALKHAQKRAADAEKKALGMAQKAEKKAAEAKNEASARIAHQEKDKADAAMKLAALAKSSHAQAVQSASRGDTSGMKQGLAFAQMAMQFAAQTSNPQGAISALQQQDTPQGRSMAASVTDAIFRDGPFNPDAIIANLASGGGVSSYGDDGDDLGDYIDGPVAGACCSSCSLGSSCGGKNKPVEQGMLDGSIVEGAEDGGPDGRSFFEFLYGEAAAPMIAGPECHSEDRSRSPFQDWDIAFGGT